MLSPGETSITADEQSLLDRICEAYYLPAWCSVADYEAYFRAEGLTDIQTADWSNEVAPFWGAVIQSALTPQGVAGLMQAGWTTIKVCEVQFIGVGDGTQHLWQGALVMPLMAQGFRRGLIKFNLITAVKPR